MLEVQKVPSIDYSEITQKSPIRWVNLYRTKGKLVPTSSWWKCKDFQNDVAYKVATKKTFDIYGFSNHFSTNRTGLYLGLRNVPLCFDHNFKLLNDYLTSRGFPKILRVSHDKGNGVEVVLFLPIRYWKNTFCISYITSLIRSCTYVQRDSVAEMVEHEETLVNGYFSKADKLFTPENVEKMDALVFCNFQYNINNLPICESYIHNAGLQAWINSWKNHD